MALEKKKPCCYLCDINLPCILYSKLLIAPPFVTNWRSLLCKRQENASNLKTVEQLHENSPSESTEG